MQKLFLIGMPGSGKTTLGRALATYYALPFLDLDAEIVNRAGQVIPAIFLEHGEVYFRRLETEVLREINSRPVPLVLATGGGTPCFHDNINALNTNGFTVWLEVAVPVLATRLAIGVEKASRPLLPTAGPTEKWLSETLDGRKQFYEQARLHYTGTADTVEVAAQLAAAGFAPLAPTGLMPAA